MSLCYQCFTQDLAQTKYFYIALEGRMYLLMKSHISMKYATRNRKKNLYFEIEVKKITCPECWPNRDICNLLRDLNKILPTK